MTTLGVAASYPDASVSVLTLHGVLEDNRVKRIDPQFFSPQGLAALSLVRSGDAERIGDICSSVRSFGAYALTNHFEYQETGIPFLRCADIRGGFVDFSDVLYIDDNANELLWKSEVSPGTVLMTMSGTVGRAAVALPDWPYPVNSNQDIAKLKLRPGWDPHVVACFINSEIGQELISRLPVGSVQQHIFLWQIEDILVPRLNSEFEGRLGDVIRLAHDYDRKSREAFASAEMVMTTRLGLDRYIEEEPVQAFTRSASQVRSAGRFDPDFLSPRVQELITRLSSQGQVLRDVAALRRERFFPAPNEDFNYLEISDVTGDGEIEGRIVAGANAPSRATQLVREGDVITSTVRPIRRLSALVRSDQDGYVCSSGFAVLRPSKVSTEVLLAYLRLPPVCELLNLRTSASMYPAISTHDLMELPFLIPPADVSEEVNNLVRMAHAARARAKKLMRDSERSIDAAIQGSWETAYGWLEA